MRCKQGAVALVTDSEPTWRKVRAEHPDLAIALVEHGRRALAEISANFFSHPERSLRLSGVTGTNGKTTTTYLLESMLRSAGRISVLVGTIEYHVGSEVRPSPHTTPESRDLFQLFAEGVAAGATEAVMEVSSHALEQGRVWGLHWDTAIFTNLTQDHLDFHGTMEAYFGAKAKMFTGAVGAAAPRVAIIHCEDEYGQRLIPMARAAGCEVVEFGLNRGDFRAVDVAAGCERNQIRNGDPDGKRGVAYSPAGAGECAESAGSFRGSDGAWIDT